MDNRVYGLILIAVIIIGYLIVMVKVFKNENERQRKHFKFINSIQPGDIFISNFGNDYDNPFEEPYEPYEFKVCDVKTNEEGIKYVQYCFTKYEPGAKRFSASAEDFVRYKKRIKKGNELF